MDSQCFREHIHQLKAASKGKEIAIDIGLRRRRSCFVCPVCHPIDEGKTPDLSVFDLGFRCFKCGTTGDVIDLVMLAGKMSKAEAIAYLENRTGITRPARKYQSKGQKKTIHPEDKTIIPKLKEKIRIIEDDAVHAILYDAFLKYVCLSVQGSPGAAYLEGGGISGNVADQYGVRFCHDVSGHWAPSFMNGGRVRPMTPVVRRRYVTHTLCA
jgi:DNA primase